MGCESFLEQISMIFSQFTLFVPMSRVEIYRPGIDWLDPNNLYQNMFVLTIKTTLLVSTFNIDMCSTVARAKKFNSCFKTMEVTIKWLAIMIQRLIRGKQCQNINYGMSSATTNFGASSQSAAKTACREGENHS